MAIFDLGLCLVMLRFIYIVAEYVFDFNWKIGDIISEIIFLLGAVMFGIVLIGMLVENCSFAVVLASVAYVLVCALLVKMDYNQYIKKDKK